MSFHKRNSFAFCLICILFLLFNQKNPGSFHTSIPSPIGSRVCPGNHFYNNAYILSLCGAVSAMASTYFQLHCLPQPSNAFSPHDQSLCTMKFPFLSGACNILLSVLKNWPRPADVEFRTCHLPCPNLHFTRMLTFFHEILSLTCLCMKQNLLAFANPEFKNFEPSFTPVCEVFWKYPDGCLANFFSFMEVFYHWRNQLEGDSLVALSSNFSFSPPQRDCLEATLLSLLSALHSSISGGFKVLLDHVKRQGYANNYGQALQSADSKVWNCWRKVLTALNALARPIQAREPMPSKRSPYLLELPLLAQAIPPFLATCQVELNALAVAKPINQQQPGSGCVEDLSFLLLREKLLLPEARAVWLKSLMSSSTVISRPDRYSGAKIHARRGELFFPSVREAIFSASPQSLRQFVVARYLQRNEAGYGEGVFRDVLYKYAQLLVSPEKRYFISCSQDKNCFFPRSCKVNAL